jgi:hypothetical protein
MLTYVSLSPLGLSLHDLRLLLQVLLPVLLRPLLPVLLQVLLPVLLPVILPVLLHVLLLVRQQVLVVLMVLFEGHPPAGLRLLVVVLLELP